MISELRYRANIKSENDRHWRIWVYVPGTSYVVSNNNAAQWYNENGEGVYQIGKYINTEVGHSWIVSGSQYESNNGRLKFITQITTAGNGDKKYHFSDTVTEGSEPDDITINVEPVVEFDTLEPIWQLGRKTNISATNITSKFEAIQPSEFILPMFDPTGDSYSDIFEAGHQQCIVQIFEGVLNYQDPYWTGRSVAQEWKERAQDVLYYKEAVFSCGLQSASETGFHWQDNPDGNHSWMKTIKNCFADGAGIALPIHENINIYRTTDDTDDNDSVLTQRDWSIERYFGRTFLDPVRDIMQQTVSRVFQWNGAWILQRINELSGEYLQRSFDADGVFVSSQWLGSSAQNIGSVEQSRDSNFIITVGAAPKVVVTYDGYYPEENAVVNGWFEEWDNEGNPPESWSLTGTNFIERSLVRETGSYSIKITPTSGVFNYLQQTLLARTEGELTFVVKPFANTPTVIAQQNNVLFWSLQNNSTGNWYDLENDNWSAVEVKNDLTLQFSQTSNRFYQVNYTIDQDPAGGGTFSTLRIYERTFTGGDGVYLDRVTYLDANNGTTVSGEPIFDPREIPIEATNNPEEIGTDPADIQYNVGQPIDNWNLWKRRGESTGQHPAQLIVQTLEEESNENQKVLKCEFSHGFLNLMLPISWKGDRYIQNGVEFNLAKGTWKGQWVQLISSPHYTELPQI